MRRRLWRLLVRHGAALFFVTLMAGYAAAPLVYHRLLATHEADDLYDRVDEIQREVARGFVQPMLFESGMHGMGYAFPIFYPPLPYYLAAVVSAICRHLFLGVNLTLAMSIVVSGWAAYLCGFHLTRRQWLAAAIAVAYIATPYRFSVTGVRGAMGEAWALAFAPLFLYGGLRVVRHGKSMGVLALATAGLLLSHAAMSQWIVLMLVPTMLVGWVLARRRDGHWRRFAELAGSGIAGFALTAWFTVPQLAHLHLMWASDKLFMWASPHFVATHRVALPQFFTSTEAQWRGGSEGWGLEDTMSFSLGPTPWIAAAALGLTLLMRGDGAWRGRLNREAMVTGLALFGTALACCAFMLYPPVLLSVLPETFTYLQFPWRMLGPTALLFAMSAGCFMVPWGKRLGVAGPLMFAAVLMLAVPDYQRLGIFNEQLRPADIAGVGSRTKDRMSGFDIKGEYLPKSYPVEDITTSRPLVAPDGARDVRFERSEDGGSYVLSARLLEPGSFVLPLVWYPFYRAEDSGGKAVALQDRGGLIAFEAPAGEISVTVERRYTWPWYAGWGVTLVSAAALAGYIRLRRRP